MIGPEQMRLRAQQLVGNYFGFGRLPSEDPWIGDGVGFRVILAVVHTCMKRLDLLSELQTLRVEMKNRWVRRKSG